MWKLIYESVKYLPQISLNHNEADMYVKNNSNVLINHSKDVSDLENMG